MPRFRHDRPLLAKAKRLERRMGRALVTALGRVRESVTVEEIVRVIIARKAKEAANLLSDRAAAEAMKVPAAIAKDAFMAGGRVAAASIRGER